jgi:hypothetical protein
MVVKTGLVVPSNRDESSDRWKFDQPGTQILLYRGFTQRIDADFFCPYLNLLTIISKTSSPPKNKDTRAI